MYDEPFEEGTHAPHPLSAIADETQNTPTCLQPWKSNWTSTTHCGNSTESPINQSNIANSIELDLEIHNEFPINNEPMEAMSAEGNVIGDLSLVNNVYKGETTDMYTNTPMEISPLVEEEPMANPPMKTSPLIYSDSTANNPMKITPVEASDAIHNFPMDTFNTPAEMRLVDTNKLHLPNGGQPSTMSNNYKHAIPGIHRHPLDASNLKAEKLVEGILVEKLFAETAVTISLADLLQESPKLRQKAHKAVSALQPHRKGRTLLGRHWSPKNKRSGKQTNDSCHS
ncbi:hypothetical protein DSO57_1014722 [Entomophthora muscae]|uniref:Uncharacterized protein n=1 Tax=Entomophthora muscae TaxID=34485 RepID=A0ACC2U3M2_9FUNG|nr:hypothetical protein DSO57_1014722 [Entomophthora muscae]